MFSSPLLYIQHAPWLFEVEYAHERKAKAAVKRWRLKNAHILPTPLRGGRITFGSRDWLKECGGKVAHLQIESALRQIAELKRKPAIHNTAGAWFTVYSCRWCEWFHIGHSTEALEREGSVVYSEKEMTSGT
jgi:hypothetical protein